MTPRETLGTLYTFGVGSSSFTPILAMSCIAGKIASALCLNLALGFWLYAVFVIKHSYHTSS